MRRVTIVLAGVFVGACVEARPLPNLPRQADIPYGPKIFLVDNTIGAAPRNGMCTRLGEVKTTTTTTVTTVMPTDGVLLPEGGDMPIDATVPHNCYVKVVPKTLKIDSVEVTNDLFQLCVDSGPCAKPDPSNASKGQVCSSEDAFERCPVVEVTHSQATRFCKFIGRRIPSGIEHIIVRQAGAEDTQDPTKIPVYPNGGREESNVPASCNVAVVGVPAGCTRPQPIALGSRPEDTKGAALLDVVNGSVGQAFDLIGNASEWSSDLMPAIRGLAMGLPWFCQGPIPPVTVVGQEPTCPAGATCVYGQYQPPNLPLDIYPVCVAHGQELRAISGAHGSLFGGNFADMKADRAHYGVFARRAEMSPDDNPAKSYGFRCAGDLGSNDAVEAAPGE